MNIANKLIVSTIALANFASNAALGTAAATVDIAANFSINQTTAGIAVTLPTPTVNQIGQIIFVQNIGSVGIIVGGVLIRSSQMANFVWSGTVWLADVGSGRATWFGSAVTNGSGVATFAFPAGLFTANPICVQSVQSGTGTIVEARLTALSTTSAQVTVSQAAGITILGIGVLAAAVAASGVTVNMIAGQAG